MEEKAAKIKEWVMLKLSEVKKTLQQDEKSCSVSEERSKDALGRNSDVTMNVWKGGMWSVLMELSSLVTLIGICGPLVNNQRSSECLFGGRLC